MPTTPITLTPVGGPVYAVARGHLIMLQRGTWVLDVELGALSVQTYGMPSGKCVVVFGGTPMTGTIDAASSGAFGPTATARIIGGGNGWSTAPPAQQWHADNGVLSTQVYETVASMVGEVLVDLAPQPLGVDVVLSGSDPASAVFRDEPWFVDTTGTTYVGPRPPAIPDASLVIRDWDPVQQKASFSCNAPLLPGTPLVDTRFGAATFTVASVEQIFDGNGSIGWAWASAPALPGASAGPATVAVDALKAAALQWTRAAYLRVYRYRFVLDQGDGPGGPPARMALQAVAPSAGMPDLLPITPWSGVAGVISTLAPSQEVLVVFENADPTLPRIIGYSLATAGGEPPGAASGLPLSTTIDASTELDVGPTVPLVKLAAGADFLVLATPYAALLSALETFASSMGAAGTPPPTTLAQVISAIAAQTAAATALSTALGALPAPATVKTKAT